MGRQSSKENSYKSANKPRLRSLTAVKVYSAACTGQTGRIVSLPKDYPRLAERKADTKYLVKKLE